MKTQKKEQNKVNKRPVLIFKLGTLQVYYLSDNTLFSPSYMATEVYWMDAGSPQGYGPFVSVHEAMTHYTQLIEAMKGGIDPNTGKPMCAVIPVDFVTKRRLK